MRVEGVRMIKGVRERVCNNEGVRECVRMEDVRMRGVTV